MEYVTEQLPEKHYERNLNHNYMIIREENPETDYGYQVRMLTDNQIKGLLPVSLRVENGVEHFYYEIQSKQTFERIYERKNISYKELRFILRSFLDLEKNLQNYLLSYDYVIIDPSFLFMDMEKQEVNFVYYPGYQQDARCGFIQLIDYMLTKTDHTDEKAVVLIYKLYRYTRNENFVLSEVSRFLEDMPSEIQLSKELAGQQIPKNMSLTGSGVESPWSSELIQTEVPSGRNITESWNQKSEKSEPQKVFEAESEEVLEKRQKKHTGRGIPSQILMFISIAISMILLAVLAAEKWLELILLQAKTEMFVFAGIIVFAGLGIVFNIMAAAQKKADGQVEEESLEKLDKKISNPIQYRQITPVIPAMPKQTELCKPERDRPMPESSTYQFFGTPGETMIMNEETEGYVLRGCDGNSFEYRLDHFPVLIGRMKPYVDVVFDDHSVSKMHAKLEKRGDTVFLEDMNSTNGTKKNGESIAINESVPLMPGDEILFGKVKLRYCTG